jgi:hypothetical protein
MLSVAKIKSRGNKVGLATVCPVPCPSDGSGSWLTSHTVVHTLARSRATSTTSAVAATGSAQGLVALSRQNQSVRISSRIWYGVVERWCRATTRPNPKRKKITGLAQNSQVGPTI